MSDNPYPIQIKKRIWFTIIIGILRMIIVALLIFGWFGLIQDEDSQGEIQKFTLVIILFALAIMGFILLVQIIWKILFLHSIKYSLDTQNFIFKGGVISRFERVLPYSKIQHVIIYETFWQRVLGLATVSVETAREGGFGPAAYGSRRNMIISTGPLIPDLIRDQAILLKDHLIKISNSKYKPIAGV